MFQATTVYSNCSCLEDGVAVSGECKKSCGGQLLGYILLLCITLFVSNIYNVPATNTILRYSVLIIVVCHCSSQL